ncbi:MAG TPA: hypothetical protein PLJ60_05720 [Chryseolinea sp.]|nr:hypothetical protein [Chryseolinea sp.]HPM29816.1 hypothetical protein [Chryseolinea sp.]
MKSRCIQLFVICILMITNAYSQNFEGTIVYQNVYKSKVPGVPDAQFSTMMGTTQEYSIKGGNYRSSMNGTLVKWQIYINQDNKLYTKMSNIQPILWNDGAVNTDEVLSSEINKNVVEILGQMCDELIMTCKSGVQKFYFSSNQKVDAGLYMKHKFANWNEVLGKANAIPLKIIMTTPQFFVESIAIEIIPKKLDDTLFKLPPDSKLEKSPY